MVERVSPRARPQSGFCARRRRCCSLPGPPARGVRRARLGQPDGPTAGTCRLYRLAAGVFPARDPVASHRQGRCGRAPGALRLDTSPAHRVLAHRSRHLRWASGAPWSTSSHTPPMPFGVGTHDANTRGLISCVDPGSPPDLLGPLGQIEQQEFCRLGDVDLESRFLTHGSPVAGRQRRAVEPHRPTNDLHPGMAIVAHMMDEGLSSG
jgi:hypothetical protein